MKYEGTKTQFWDIYIDTTAVKEAIYSDGESIETVACDTDMFCLRLHHKWLFLTSVEAFSWAVWN